MHMCEQWWLHCTSQWEWETPLSEHAYDEAVTFKMTEPVEQQICIKFYIKFECSSTETIQVIQKATAMGNWWLAASSQQRAGSGIMPLVKSFSGKTQITQVIQPPMAQIWCPVTSGFSPNENNLWKGRDFRPSVRFKKIWQGSWWRLGEPCEVLRCLHWRGLRCHCPTYHVSCILYLLQWMSLFFILHGWILSGQTSYLLAMASFFHSTVSQPEPLLVLILFLMNGPYLHSWMVCDSNQFALF